MSAAKLSPVDVKRIAKLARLEISDSEVEELTSQLSETTSYIDILNELDTSSVDPTFQVNNKINVTRADAIGPSLTQAQALSQAPAVYDGFFKTDATIKK